MCTKEEVRQVVRSEAPSKIPPVLLNLLGAGILVLLSWLAFDANQKDKTISEAKRTNEVALAVLTGNVELLATNLSNIKEIAVSRSTDRYTGSQAKSDKALFEQSVRELHRRHDMSQERQDRADKRINSISNLIKEYHSSVGP